jgi:hypothetical protein
MTWSVCGPVWENSSVMRLLSCCGAVSCSWRRWSSCWTVPMLACACRWRVCSSCMSWPCSLRSWLMISSIRPKAEAVVAAILESMSAMAAATLRKTPWYGEDAQEEVVAVETGTGLTGALKGFLDLEHLLALGDGDADGGVDEVDRGLVEGVGGGEGVVLVAVGEDGVECGELLAECGEALVEGGEPLGQAGEVFV